MAAELPALIARLEAATQRLEQVVPKFSGGTDASSPVDDRPAPSVLSYDAAVDESLGEFFEQSSKIGGDVATIADMVKTAFAEQREILIKASKCKKPEQAAFMSLLKPLSTAISDVQAFKEKNRGSKLFNHLSAVAESIPALGWVTVAPTPAPYVGEMIESGTFYGNRVIKEYKGNDELHVNWYRSMNKTLAELQKYVKQEHTTGLVWNARGDDVANFASKKSAAPPPPPPPAGGGPPPPPPPPPAADLAAAASTAPSDDDGRSALFAELNKGTDVTKGLKKVTDDMKTHKNPTLRQGPQPFKPKPGPKPGAKASSPPAQKAADKPATTTLDGKKWIVEYHKGNQNVVVEDTVPKQVVYIFKCENSTIQIKGKVNSITVDSCKKVGLVFDDVISSCDTVNSQRVQVQVTGKVPTITIDKTDGFMVYLSKNSLDAEIVTAKSSEMNVLVPDDSGEFKEFPVPEQFKTVWNGNKLVTSTSEIAG